MLSRVLLSLVVMSAMLMLTVAPSYSQRPGGGGTTAPLTSVTHDGTLAGDGTTASPLRVVSPYTGVVHDNTLTGAGTTASPLRVAPSASPISPLTVVDSTGTTVGRFGYPNLAYVKIDNQLVASPLAHRDNLFADGLDFTQLSLYYTTTDCTGTTYISPEDFAAGVPNLAAVQPFGVRSAVLAKVGGLTGQVIAFIDSGNEWQASQMNFLSARSWNGNNYACVASQGGKLLLPTSEVDVTGMFHEPLVIQ